MNEPYSGKIGYTRAEFRSLIQIYSQYVYTGLFRDFSFADVAGRYYISFCEESGKTPLITIEKRPLGPERSLFVATTPTDRGGFREVARSEKIDHFTRDLRNAIEVLRAAQTKSPSDTSFRVI